MTLTFDAFGVAFFLLALLDFSTSPISRFELPVSSLASALTPELASLASSALST
ncbi:hypothetical protein [Thermanaeromonas sp. C210]|uniref:hypothetical protein n=1 Tax=Thermanaeromonas sp. C210 TaxID=2731925 RepID=UPI0015646ABC|nr:hypothetical protein [Thermanaeromonas sp. C210]